MDTVIATAGLGKQYGDRRVVDDLALDVRQGEIYGFLGLNGAGKTTTIRMLLGMVRPSVGAAMLFGQPVRAQSRVWSRVGFLVEAPHAYPELTVRENLDLVRRLRHLRPDTVGSIMARLDLAVYADRRAGTLSLGNLQRLGLAKALLHNPALLILDEPTNGLDPAGVVEVREMLRDLAHQHGVTIFMSSHILTEVARIATRIGILSAGRLITEYDAGAIEGQRQRRLVVGATDRQRACAALGRAGYVPHLRDDGLMELREEGAIRCPERVARTLVAADVPPTHLVVEHEDLETYFLRLVGAS